MTTLAFGAEFLIAWGRDGVVGTGDSVFISSLGKDGLVVGTGEAVVVPSSSGLVTTFVGEKVLLVPATVVLTIVGVGIILKTTVGVGEAFVVPSTSGLVTTFVGEKVLLVPAIVLTIVGVGVMLEFTVGVGEAVVVPSPGRITTFVGEKVSKIGSAEVERSDATAGWDEDSSDDGVLETSDGLGDGDEVS